MPKNNPISPPSLSATGSLSYLIAFVAWALPFFFPNIFLFSYAFLLVYCFFIYRIKVGNAFFTTGNEYPKLKDYSHLVKDVSPLYEWEEKNHPFLSSFPALRFARKENPTTLEDFQAIYINSKENILYLFNLTNQEPAMTLQGFMIEDLQDFYMVMRIPNQQMWQRKNTYLPYVVEGTFDELRFAFKNIQHAHSTFVSSIHLVFELENTSNNRLEASLYPSNPDKIPYFVGEKDPHYVSLLEKGTNIISFLEVLQGGFFWETKPKISLDGVLRLEFNEN